MSKDAPITEVTITLRTQELGIYGGLSMTCSADPDRVAHVMNHIDSEELTPEHESVSTSEMLICMLTYHTLRALKGAADQIAAQMPGGIVVNGDDTRTPH